MGYVSLIHLSLLLGDSDDWVNIGTRNHIICCHASFASQETISFFVTAIKTTTAKEVLMSFTSSYCKISASDKEGGNMCAKCAECNFQALFPSLRECYTILNWFVLNSYP